MGYLLDDLRSRYDRIAIPTIWVAFALSLMLHGLLLSGWIPKVHLQPFEELTPGPKSNTLAVHLAPMVTAPPTPPPAPAIRAQPEPAHRSPPPAAAARQKPAAPQVLAMERPSASSAAPRPAETTRPQASEDFAAFIEARRRARAPETAPPPSPSPPAETEQQRINRLAAENLGLTEKPSFGTDKNRGGGIFQIERMGVDSAEFMFFGWNKFINRNSQQMIEVRRGDNASLEIAVVRRMIAIIREHESRDFIWQSRRLGREVNLSARLSDNAGLEEFMMREFFAEARPRN